MPMTSNGYRPRTSGEWYALLRGNVEALLASIGKAPPRWQPHEFITMFYSTTAFAIAELDEAISAIQDARSIYNASGAYLSELATLMGIQRSPGRKSTVTLTVGAWATGSVLLSKGSKAQGGGEDGLAIWVTTDDVVIPAGGTATVTAECEVVGQIAAGAGDIVRRVSGTTGWASVTNADAADLGAPADSDSSLRQRILTFRSVGARSPLALKGALERDTAAQRVIVHFNTSMSTVLKGNASVPACGMAIWVWPAALPNVERQKILRAIYSFKDGSSAIALPANSGEGARGTIVGADGLVNAIGYFFVQPQYYKVNVVVTSFEANYTLAKVSAPVQAAAKAYFDALSPGDAVRQNDLLGAIAAVPGVGRATVTMAHTDPGDDPSVSGNYTAFSNADVLTDVYAIAQHYLTTVSD